MPTRKSDVSVARFVLADEDSAMTTESPAPEAAEPPASTMSAPHPSSHDKKEKEKDREKEKEKERERDTLTIEDLVLPKSIVTRLAKGVLPPNTQIQANAILALTKGATVFINHLANAANEHTVASNKKTIMPADVFKALEEIEYGFMRERLEAEFAKFNEVQTSKRSTYRKKVAAAKKAAAAGTGQSANESMMSTGSAVTDGDGAHETDRSLPHTSASGGADQARAAKKARIDPGADDSKMEVGDHDPSDAETVPDEPEEEEDDEDEEVEEEEEEEEEEDEPEAADEDRDDLEERTARGVEDEALDDDSD
ncbi:hypothetical protein VTK56DRAFT_1970 [Thermocarpiscus australiensis]